MTRARNRGFTLLELLVALAILGIIVVVCGRIFQQSSAAWETGVRRAERAIIGRGLADFLAQDLSRAACRDAGDLTIGGNTLRFPIVDEQSVRDGSVARAFMVVEYSLAAGSLRRKGGNGPWEDLAPPDVVDDVTVSPGPAAGDLPAYADVTVRVKDVGSSYTEDFKTRAWLTNRDRHYYDD